MSPSLVVKGHGMKIAFQTWLIFLLCAAAADSISAQKRVEAHDCTKTGKNYKCDQDSFAKLLQISRTVALVTPRLDPASAEQLQKLGHALGKTVLSSGADLTLVISHPDSSGIYYGPSGRELAVLLVYHGASNNQPGSLVWVETCYAQPDTPWPIAVNHLIQQFRKRFGQ